MKWLLDYLTSSIGRKLTMGLTGLFLILFLIVHLLGNFQLLKDDGGEAFNKYTYFMTHNPLIKTVSYGLYFFILLHTVQGLALWLYNRKAKGQSYAVKAQRPGVAWASENMALLGTFILFFLVLHMGDFWLKMKMGAIPLRAYENFADGEPIADLYIRVAAAFSEPFYVVTYMLSMVILYFHLAHGFQSAFQTMGWSHPKYTPFIRNVGKAYAVLIPLGFAAIPLLFYILK
jgi:succinate dehydrogenase / fumarate reductase, cytochrome b subunit